MDASLQREFDQLAACSPWLASFVIDGRAYGAGLNHDRDVRPPLFFRLVPHVKRILELGSCQGGGTFQLARHPGVEEVVGIEGRAYHLEKARLVQRALRVENIRFHEGDLETFDFTPLGRFDAVYCVGLLYHLPCPWELLSRLSLVSDVLYLNTHYCPRNQVDMVSHGYEGKKWLEAGYEDPLSGLSSWSFWPTLAALADMLLDSGFVPEIAETNTLGCGQAPRGTTILARRTAALSEDAMQNCLLRLRRVLSRLSASAGGLPPPSRPSWLKRTMAKSRRLVGRLWR